MLKKRLGTMWHTVMTVLLAVLMVVGVPTRANSASNSSASSAISSLKSQSGFTAGTSYGGGGCWSFVDAVCRKLYGQAAPGGTSGYELKRPGNYPLVGQVTAPTQAAVKNLLLQGYPGDIVQLKGGSGGYVSSQHTFILEAVDDNGITIWEHLDSTGVRTATYTWSDFYSRYGKFSSSDSAQGVSLYHFNDYNSVFPATHQCAGYVDAIVGGDGTVYVKGWAYDPDAPSQSCTVDIYVGGWPGSGVKYHRVSANQYRSDVNAAKGITGNHGFEVTFDTDMTGSQTVYVFALDVSGGDAPPLLGSNTVDIYPKASVPSGVVAIEGKYSIRSALDPTKALTVAQSSNADGAAIQISTWSNAANQSFSIGKSSSTVGGNSRAVTALHSNKRLDLPMASPLVSGTALIQYPATNRVNQDWYFVPTGHGSYNVVSACSGMKLDVRGGATTNGTVVQQYTSKSPLALCG